MIQVNTNKILQYVSFFGAIITAMFGDCAHAAFMMAMAVYFQIQSI